MSFIRDKRKRLGLSQTELAAKVGIKQPLISNLERGRLALWPAVTKRLAEALAVSEADLRKGVKKPHITNFLRQARQLRGFTLAELSQLIGISPSRIGNIERGGIPVWPKAAKKLADTLRFSMYELFPNDTNRLVNHFDCVPIQQQGIESWSIGA